MVRMYSLDASQAKKEILVGAFVIQAILAGKSPRFILLWPAK